MALIVASAVTLRAQIYQRLMQDTTFMSHLGNDTTRILPYFGQPAIDVMPHPFVEVAFMGRGSPGSGATDRGLWTISLHDDPLPGNTWTLDLLTRDIRRLFADARWQLPTDTTSDRASWSRWAGATKDFIDRDYQTRCVITSIQLDMA